MTWANGLAEIAWFFLAVLQNGSSHKNMSSCLYLFVWVSSSEHTKGEWSPKGKISLPIAAFVFVHLCRSFSSSGCQAEKGTILKRKTRSIFYRKNEWKISLKGHVNKQRQIGSQHSGRKTISPSKTSHTYRLCWHLAKLAKSVGFYRLCWHNFWHNWRKLP